MQVTVVGAGVIGMTTALALEEAGHDVRIVAANVPDDTVSAVAGAVWFPYRAGPPDRVAAWAAHGRAWLAELARFPETGVDLVTGYEITPDAGVDVPRPWWAAHIEVARAPARSPARRSPGATTRRASSRRGSCRGSPPACAPRSSAAPCSTSPPSRATR